MLNIISGQADKSNGSREAGQAAQLPFAVTALLLFSIAAFAWVKGGSWLLLLAALGIMGSHLSPARITSGVLLWVARFLACGLALFTAFLTVPHADQQFTILDPHWANLFGYLCAGELVVQAWSTRKSLVGMILLSSLLCLLLSDSGPGILSNALPFNKVALIAPGYILLVTLCFRHYRPRARTRGSWGLLCAGLLMLVTVGVGYMFYTSIYANRMSLFDWSERWFGPGADRALGLSLDPRLGETFGDHGSPRRMLQVEGYGGGYLRGLAFDIYANGRWTPTLSERTFAPLPVPARNVPATAPEVHISELASTDSVLYLPSETADLRRGVAQKWCPADGGPVESGSTVPERYAVLLAAGEGGSFWPAPSPAERHRMLDYPRREIDPRVAQLAVVICESAPTPQQKIVAVINYLQSHNAYSLRVKPGHGDPISNFILQRKSAHCEYFASAATMLLRAQGVPTRYVIGYYAHEVTGPGQLIVRLQDAHAWAESWVDGAGWVVVDATPGAGRPDQSAMGWQTWCARAWEQAQARFQHFRDWIVARTPFQLALLLLATILPFFLLQIWNNRRKRDNSLPAPLYHADDPAVLQLGERFSAWLLSRGHACPPAVPWRDHLLGYDAPQSAVAFVQLYNTARFGKQIDERTLEALRELLDMLEQVECEKNAV